MNKCLSVLASFALVVASACEKGSPLAPPTPSPSPTPISFSFYQFTGGMDVGASLLPTWALRGDNSELLVKQAVFGDNDAKLTNPGLRPLVRFGLSAVIASYPPELEAFLPEYLKGKAEWERLTGIPMTLQKGGIGQLKLMINPTGGGTMFGPEFGPNGDIIGGTIAFKTLESSVNYHNFVHELSHFAGLYHHQACGVASQRTCEGETEIRFSQKEIDDFHQKQKLASGTPWPAR